jgi:hypothetical protein
VSAYKKGDRVIVDTSGWSGQARQRALIVRVGTLSIGIVWETGELAGRGANVERASFDVAEVLK